MENRRNAYRDIPGSTSSRRSFSASGAASNANNCDFCSQASSYQGPLPNFSGPHQDLENLDLNSQGDGFPFIDAYFGYLHPTADDGAPVEQITPPQAVGEQVTLPLLFDDDRGRYGHAGFVAPHRSGLGDSSATGGAQAGHAGRHHGRSATPALGSGRNDLRSSIPNTSSWMGGGGRRQLMCLQAARGFMGPESTFFAPSSLAFPAENVIGNDYIEQADDNVHHFVSAVGLIVFHFLICKCTMLL